MNPTPYYEYRLVCWSCGKRSKKSEHVDPPRLNALEIDYWARHTGWVTGWDNDRSRLLVFCSRRCHDAARTQKGRFLKHSPKITRS